MPEGLTAWNVITLLILIGGFIANAAYLKGTFTIRISNNEEDIRNLKSSVRYEDTCDSTVKGLDTRIANLEKVRNSGGG